MTGEPKKRGYRGVAGTCRWCGDKLYGAVPGSERIGYGGHGVFCSARCGYQRGLDAEGFHIVPRVPRLQP